MSSNSLTPGYHVLTNSTNSTTWEIPWNTTHENSYSSYSRTIISVFGIISAVISLIGIVCNSLNIIVLIRIIRKLSTSPIYHLLLAIGVGDLMALIFLAIYYITMFFRWPPILYQDVVGYSESGFVYVVMHIWYFPANIFSLSSTWCIVSLTIFRFLAVTFPVKVSQWCTVERIRLTIVLIYTSSFLVNLPDCLTIKFDRHFFASETSLYQKIKFYYIIYQVVEVGIPFCINTVLVVSIIRNLYKTRHKIMDMIANGYSVTKEKEQRRIGQMLISVIILFTVCHIPQVIYIMLRDFGGTDRMTFEADPSYQVFTMISTVFLLINQSANVFFYCLFNKNYRRNLYSTFTIFTRRLGIKDPLSSTFAARMSTYYQQQRLMNSGLHDRSNLDSQDSTADKYSLRSRHVDHDLSVNTEMSVMAEDSFSLKCD